jgi:nicotinate (nicotinamide) nucleotide adenylyltransferase
VFGGSFNPVHLGHLLVADEIAEILDLERVLFVPAASPPHKPATALAPARHRFEMTRLAVAEHPRFEVSDVELRRSGPSYTVDTLEALAPRGDLHLIIGSETFLDLLSWREPRRVAALARLVVVPRTGGGFDPESALAQKVLMEVGLGGFVSPSPSAGAQKWPPLSPSPRTPEGAPPLSPSPRTPEGAPSLSPSSRTPEGAPPLSPSPRTPDALSPSPRTPEGAPSLSPSPRTPEGAPPLSPSPRPVLAPAASLPISGSDLRKRAREGRSLAFRMPAAVAAYIREHRLYQGGA